MLDGPHASPVPDSLPADSPEVRIQAAEQALVRAEQRAADSEQLYKEGILARVEAEDRALKVVKARKELADASLALAAEQADAAKKAFDSHKEAQKDLDAANASLKTAQDADTSAEGQWEKGQIDAAAVDLKRKQKLYSEGVGSRREVEIAQDHLALVSGTTAK